MNYICLAAGKGTRFNGLGTYLQKCMYPINGKPFLQYSLNNLINAKIFNSETDKLIIVIGHFSFQIKNYFGNKYKGITINYVYQENAMGTAHALMTAYEESGNNDNATVWLADTLISKEMFRNMHFKNSEIVLSLSEHLCNQHHGERVSLSENRKYILSAWNGSSNFIEIGFWKVNQYIIDELMNHKVDEHRYLPVVDSYIKEKNGFVVPLFVNTWVHLGGTEPSVVENIKFVSEYISSHYN